MRSPILFVVAGILAIAGHAVAQQHVIINDGAATVQRDGPVLSIDASGIITAAWDDYRDGSQQVYVSRSTDGGFTWSSNKRASSTSAVPTGAPVLTTEVGGKVTIAWGDLRRPPMWSRVDVCVAHSADGGLTFNPDPRINDDSYADQQQPEITSIGGTVFTVWHGYPSTSQPKPATPLWVSRSTDGGATFEAQVRVDSYAKTSSDTIGTCNCCPTDIFTNGASNVYAPYRIDSSNMRDIFMARSTDNGMTWLPAVRVSHGRWILDACPGTGPSGAARGDTLWVSYMDQRNSTAPTIYVSRSTDGGATFGTDVKVGDNGNFPSLVADGRGRVFCLWSDVPRNNRANVYVAVSTNSGNTFGPPVRINPDTSIVNAQIRCVVAPNDSVYCTWREVISSYRNSIAFTNVKQLLYPAPSEVHESRVSAPELFSIAPQPLIAGQPAEILMLNGVSELKIVDMLGREVSALALTRMQTSTTQLITLQNPGVYYIIGRRGTERFARPVVVR